MLVDAPVLSRKTKRLGSTPPLVQEESPNRPGALCRVLPCLRSLVRQDHVPWARMGVRRSGPHHWKRFMRSPHAPGSPDPASPPLRHPCPLTSSHLQQPHVREPIMRPQPERLCGRPRRAIQLGPRTSSCVSQPCVPRKEAARPSSPRPATSSPILLQASDKIVESTSIDFIGSNACRRYQSCLRLRQTGSGFRPASEP